MARPVAALTGATGFLGRWLAPALHDAGYEVRVLVGRDPISPLWSAFEPQVVIGRLVDDVALGRLVEDASLVVHAAGLIKARTRGEFFRVNEGGTQAVARAAAAGAPGAHVVLVSSLSARAPHLSAYAASKAAAENAARGILSPSRLSVVRPPAVYGPGDRETLAIFKAAGSLPLLPLPGPARARLAVIHVADAAAQIAAVGAASTRGGTYALSDARPDGYGWIELMQAVGEAVGRRPPMARLPPAALLAAGGLIALAGRLAGQAPILTPGKVREVLHGDWSVSPREQFAGAPACRFDLASGLADTVSWYRANAWL